MAKINLFLGHKCNFNCSYCLQSFDADEYLHMDDVDLDKLADQLAQEAKDRHIQKISYWGGEPLLYFDKIVALHEKFAERGVKFNFVKFLTNGSLLNEDRVKKLNEMNAYVGVSIHTGFGEPNWKMLEKLNKWSVIYLHTGKTHDFDVIAASDELEKKHGISGIQPFMHWVRATENCGEEDYFTWETLAKHKDYLIKLADKRLAGNEKAFWLFQPHLEKYIAKMNQGNWSGAMCVNSRILTVDMYGNKFTCHHSPTKENYIGNVFHGEKELPNTDIEAAKAVQMQYVNSEECKVCPIRNWCRGNCYLSNTHELDCALMKIKAEVYEYILIKEREAQSV